jgi:hypothetical protein
VVEVRAHRCSTERWATSPSLQTTTLSPKPTTEQPTTHTFQCEIHTSTTLRIVAITVRVIKCFAHGFGLVCLAKLSPIRTLRVSTIGWFFFRCWFYRRRRAMGITTVATQMLGIEHPIVCGGMTATGSVRLLAARSAVFARIVIPSRLVVDLSCC